VSRFGESLNKEHGKLLIKDNRRLMSPAVGYL